MAKKKKSKENSNILGNALRIMESRKEKEEERKRNDPSNGYISRRAQTIIESRAEKQRKADDAAREEESRRIQNSLGENSVINRSGRRNTMHDDEADRARARQNSYESMKRDRVSQLLGAVDKKRKEQEQQAAAAQQGRYDDRMQSMGGRLLDEVNRKKQEKAQQAAAAQQQRYGSAMQDKAGQLLYADQKRKQLEAAAAAKAQENRYAGMKQTRADQLLGGIGIANRKKAEAAQAEAQAKAERTDRGYGSAMGSRADQLLGMVAQKRKEEEEILRSAQNDEAQRQKVAQAGRYAGMKQDRAAEMMRMVEKKRAGNTSSAADAAPSPQGEGLDNRAAGEGLKNVNGMTVGRDEMAQRFAQQQAQRQAQAEKNAAQQDRFYQMMNGKAGALRDAVIRMNAPKIEEQRKNALMYGNYNEFTQEELDEAYELLKTTKEELESELGVEPGSFEHTMTEWALSDPVSKAFMAEGQERAAKLNKVADSLKGKAVDPELQETWNFLITNGNRAKQDMTAGEENSQFFSALADGYYNENSEYYPMVQKIVGLLDEETRQDFEDLCWDARNGNGGNSLLWSKSGGPVEFRKNLIEKIQDIVGDEMVRTAQPATTGEQAELERRELEDWNYKNDMIKDLDKRIDMLIMAQDNLDERKKYEAMIPEGVSGEYIPEDISWGNFSNKLAAEFTGILDGANAQEVYVYANEGTSEYPMTNTVTWLMGRDSASPHKTKPAYMTAEEKDTFNKLYRAGMKDEAFAFYQALSMTLNARISKDVQAEAELAGSGAQGPVRAQQQLFSDLATSPIRMGAAVLGAFGDRESQDPNSWAWQTDLRSNVIKNERIQKMGDATERNGLGRGVGETIARSVFSLENQLIIYGGAGAFGNAAEASETMVLLPFMFESGAQEAYQSMKDGKSPIEAMIRGVISGMCEGGTEKYLTMDNVFRSSLSDKWWRTVMKGTVSEIGEELTTNYAMKIVDDIGSMMTGDLPEINRKALEYARELAAKNGTTEEEEYRNGLRMAEQDWTNENIETIIDTALTTLGLFGGRGISNMAGQRSTGARVQKGSGAQENIKYLTQIGQSMKEGTRSSQLAADISDKLEMKKKVSSREIGALIQNIAMEGGEQVSQETEKTAKEIVAERLQESGVGREDAKSQADIVVKAAMNGVEALNRSERKALDESIPAFDVYMAMVSPEQMADTEAAAQAKETADMVNMGVGLTTGQQRANMRTVAQIAEGKNVNELIGRDHTHVDLKAVQEQLASEEVITTAQAQEVFREKTLAAVAAGEAAEIEGIRDGKAEIRKADGTTGTVELADIKAGNRQVAELVTFLRTHKGVMSDDVATKALAAIGAEGENASGRFAQDAAAISFAAWERKQSMPRTSLQPEVAEELWKTAQADVQKANAARIRPETRAQEGKGTASFDGAAYGTKEWTRKLKETVDDDTRRKANATAEVARILGQKVNFIYDNSENGKLTNGDFNQETGEITINLAAQRLVWDPESGKEVEKGTVNPLATISHEMTHGLQTTSADGFERLTRFVVDEMEASGVDMEQKILDTMDSYNKFYQDNDIRDESGEIRQMTAEDAMYEIVANSCEGILTSEEFAKRMQKADAGLYGKVKDYVQRVVARIRTALQDIRGSLHGEAQMIRDVDEMARIWLGAYDEVIHGAVVEAQQQEAMAQENIRNIQETGIVTPTAEATTAQQLQTLAEQQDMTAPEDMELGEEEDTSSAAEAAPSPQGEGLDNRAAGEGFENAAQGEGFENTEQSEIDRLLNVKNPYGTVNREAGAQEEQAPQKKRGLFKRNYSIQETKTGTIETADGTPIAQEMKGGVVSSYSIRTVDKTVNDELIKSLVEKGYKKKDVQKWVSDVQGIAKMIADDAQRLDFTANGGTMLKNNQEYIKTLDASTLCAKRLLYQGIFNQIQHMLPNTALMPDDLIKLTNMMKERGMVTPCSICYVESRRRLLGKYADEWLKTYDGAYKPRIEEVTTTDGLQALRESTDPAKQQAAQDFTDAMNAKGSANPKLVQLRTEYNGEIKDMTDNQIKKVKEIGGLRVQSFSDFEIVHMLDMMQAVMDMAAKDLTSQAYTKVPEFAWVFGDTGIKINLSLIGEGSGLDENGKLKFSSTEGMDIEEAMRIRSKYSKNVGTILVGMNNEHIIAAMGDDRIDFIIPFHKSGWSKKEMSLMIGMGQYKDFTRWQNEKRIGEYSKDGYKTIPNKKSKISNFGPVNSSQVWDGQNGYWDFSKTGQQNAEEYLRLCKEDGRVPKFANFLVYDGDGGFMLPQGNDEQSRNIRKGYWKLLIDFKMYDNSGKGSPQTSVKPTFNMEKARDILNKYEGGADTLPKNDSLANAFVEEYKAAHPGKKSFSIQDRPEMDIRMWLEGVPESSLTTEAERVLIRQYKGLAKAIEVNQENQRSLKRRISFMEERINKLTPKEKSLLKGLKIRLENAASAEKANQAKMDKFVSQEGFARIMRERQEMLNNFVTGKNQEEVNAAVEKMQQASDKLQADIDRTREELKALADSHVIREVRSRIGNRTLDSAATRIRKNYNSTINKTELMNSLAKISLMIENAADAEEIEAEIETLAGQIIENRKSSERNQSLEMLKGITLRLSKSKIRELTGSDSGIKELRRMMAGSGVKVVDLEAANRRNAVTDAAGNTVKGNAASLDASWDELKSFVPALDGYGGIDTDNELNQPRAVAEFVMNAMAEQRESGKKEFEGRMAEVIADLSQEISGIKMNLPSDPATLRRILGDMEKYVTEIAGKASKAARQMYETQLQAERMMGQGRTAAAWSRNMKNDIAQTIEYFNKTAQLAVNNEKRVRQDEIIRQLKDKYTQKMAQREGEWREMMRRDTQARLKREDTRASRNRMTKIVNRIGRLLKNPTAKDNVQEEMNPLAREVLNLIVSNDLNEFARKITTEDRDDIGDLKRRLDAWAARDGGYSPDDITDPVKRDLVETRMEELKDAIKEWNGKYNGKNALDTVQQMNETIKKIEEAVTDLSNIIDSARKLKLWHRETRIQDFVDYVRYETNGKKAKEWTGKTGRAIAAMHKAIVSGNMTPEYFFRSLDNKALSELWEEYHRAENRNGLELQKAQQRMEAIADLYGYKNWDMKEKHRIQLEKGGEVELTLGQIMSLWATWNREQILGPEMSQHLEKGGFYAEKDLKEGILGKTQIEKKAHRMTGSDWVEMTHILTEEQRKFIEEIVHFMSHDMSQLGNEASMDAYGIKLYKEKYYYPFKMWDGIKDKRSNDSGSAASRNEAFHPSFAKSRMHGANNALVIGDFMETVADHIVGMINYATMGLANETMMKVLNSKVEEGYDMDTITKRNIRTVLEEAYGKEAMQYLRNLQDQLNGGAVATQKTIGDKAISLFRKNAVAGSMSVALQQPLSYIRAAMLMNPKYLAEGLSPATWKGSFREMLEHSGVAVIKDMGRFDMGFGQSAREYLTPDGKESGIKKAWGKITDTATALPELMDRMTWTRMWSAVKAEQKAEHPEMDPKSDEFLDMCGVRFNDIMRRTQVYDSVLVKSQNMRNEHYWVKGITSFMAEPTLTLNVMADAVRMAKNGEKGGMAMVGKAGATFMLGAVLQAVFKGLLGAGRNPDEKKTFEENLLYRFGNSLMSEINPAGLIPGYGDLVTLLKKGELSDDAMGAIGKIITAGKGTIDVILGNGKKGTYRDIEDSAAQLVQLFTNLPARNIMRDVRAMYNFFTQPYAKRETSGNVLKYQALDSAANNDSLLGAINGLLGDAGYQTKNEAYYRRIYEAKKAGNDTAARGMTEYMTQGKGVKEKTISDALVKAAKADDSLSVDEKAGILSDGDDYNENWWKMDRDAYKKETGKDPGSNGYYYRLTDAINANSVTEIREAVDELKNHGISAEKIKGKLSDWKSEYLAADNAGKVRIRNAMQIAYKEIGYTAEDADKTISKWK